MVSKTRLVPDMMGDQFDKGIIVKKLPLLPLCRNFQVEVNVSITILRLLGPIGGIRSTF